MERHAWRDKIEVVDKEIRWDEFQRISKNWDFCRFRPEPASAIHIEIVCKCKFQPFSVQKN